MVGDPNWLYSTIAQASATIVAIIGGFITATILRSTAEKRSLVKRLEWLNSYTKSSLAPITENIEELKREIPTLEARIETFSYPQNLKYGIGVLCYLAASIVFPVRVIANGVYTPLTKQLAIGLFFSGLGAILVYIASQIYRLRRRQ